MEIKFRYITPETVEEARDYTDDIDFFLSFFPLDEEHILNAEELIEQYVPFLTLIYLGKLPFGAFYLTFSKRSAELHGVIRTDLKQLFPDKHNMLRQQVYEWIFNVVFMEENKTKLICKLHPFSKGGLGFVRFWGFKKVMQRDKTPKLDHNRVVYRLNKKTYLEKLHVLRG